MGPQNGIMGDEAFGMTMPETRVSQEDVDKERQLATSMVKFSKTAEFKRMQEWIEQRIAYYEKYLPGQVPAENVPDDERGKYWAVSNIVIQELRSLIGMYETADAIVKDMNKRT